MNINLENLEMTDSGVYQVTDARGNDVPGFTITVASPGSKKAVSAQFKRDEARSARTLGAIGGVKSKRTAEDDLRERADFLMAITEGCSAENLAYRGKTGQDALKAMYMEPKLKFIADGVEKYHNDMGNFSADSANDSSSTPATQPG